MVEVLDFLENSETVLTTKVCTSDVKRPKAKATVRNGVLLFTPNASQVMITLPAASADPLLQVLRLWFQRQSPARHFLWKGHHYW